MLMHNLLKRKVETNVNAIRNVFEHVGLNKRIVNENATYFLNVNVV